LSLQALHGRIDQRLAREPGRVVLILALVLLGSLAALWVGTSEPPRPPVGSEHYYFDLNTGKVFEAAMDVPPVAAPSGPDRQSKQQDPAGITAYRFSCSSCEHPGDRFTGWVETYPAGINAPSLAERLLQPKDWANHGISFPNGVRWFHPESHEGRRIMQAIRRRCPDQIVWCLPDAQHDFAFETQSPEDTEPSPGTKQDLASR
jgi:hypothetical protein